MKDWIKNFYEEHKWLSIMAVGALVLGILFLCIGFWRTLLLAVLVALGVLVGTLLDRGGWAAVKDFFASIFQKR
ncbi:MAG: DUF2273 domain-containing protein [Clostridia bacterium]|nr:DUF2273 domain-containing protein [Clostridia bacterium]MBR0357481.1 DUF2273 domain-containing protein [Clostridia bacterium]